MPKVYLCSFASSDLDLSVKRFLKQAEALEFFEDIKIFRPENLTTELNLRIKHFNYPIKKMRLYGYACWKPYIVDKYFQDISDDSILLYADIGVHFNKSGLEKLNNYVKICEEKNALVFQYFKPTWGSKYEKFKFQEYFEYEYTKSETWKFMKLEKDSKILNSEQIMSGCFFLKKNNFSKSIISEWLKLSKIDNMLDDVIKFNLHEKFKEHRHDQSIFSLLCKKNNVFALSASECEWAVLNNKRVWDHLTNYPILAKRDKKFNLIKRFINRQKKNIKKILKI